MILDSFRMISTQTLGSHGWLFLHSYRKMILTQDFWKRVRFCHSNMEACQGIHLELADDQYGKLYASVLVEASCRMETWFTNR